MAGRAGEASLISAVEKLEGDLVKVRNEGLEELRRIFGQARSTSRIDELGDNAFHKILETLFRIVRAEKPNYVRAAKPNSRTSSASRLENTASALRLIVESVGDRLKQKTASAVLDHIISTLPEVDGGFCVPIQTHYLKTLRILLTYAPRREHLRPKQWHTYVDFVVDNIAHALSSEVHGDDESQSLRRDRTSTPAMSMSLRLSQSTAGRLTRQTSEHQLDEALCEDLLAILVQLTGTTNAPIMTRLYQITDLVLSWLDSFSKSRKIVTRSEEFVLEILNNILPTALVEDVALSGSMISAVVQTILQRELWSPKTRRSDNLRECLLVTLTFGRALFLNTTLDPPLIATDLMEQMFESMRSDYQKTPDRERLQIDDVVFRYDCSLSPLSLDDIELSSDLPRTVNTWSSLSTMACLLTGIVKRRSKSDRNDTEQLSSKRRKLANPVDDILKVATGVAGPGQLVSLQIGLFVIQEKHVLTDSVMGHLTQINLTDLEDEPSVASWTCLLLARISSANFAFSATQIGFWKKVWTWACRLSGASSTSRASCYLLYTLIRTRTVLSKLSAQVICDGIFSDGASGPSTLTDAAMLLLHHVLSSGLINSEKTYRYFSSRTLRWLDNTWSLSADRLHNAQMANFARTELLYALLMSVLGVRVNLRSSSLPPVSSGICKALLVNAEDLRFSQYMLSDGVDSTSKGRSPDSLVIPYAPSTNVLRQLKQTIFTILNGKVKYFSTMCKTLSIERSSSVSLDILEVAATACVLCYIIEHDSVSEQDWVALNGLVMAQWEVVCDFLASQLQDSFIKAFTKISSRLTDVELLNLEDQSSLSLLRAELSIGLDQVLKKFTESQERLTAMDIDIMDNTSSRPSQSSQTRPSQKPNDTVRLDLGLFNDAHTSFSRQRLILQMDMGRVQAAKDNHVHIGATFVDIMTSLEPEDLLASRDMILDFLGQEPPLTRDDASRILTRMAEVCLQSMEYERCEVALCLCLRVTTLLTSMWTADADDELADVAWDIYQWYIGTALGKNIASQRVLLSIASLLDKILLCNTSYGTDSLPSPRTSLLQILQSGQTGLKFQLRHQLSNLFNGYILSEHAAVFDDVIENLPRDPDRREGIAVRLYLIASLGAQWHTILRQSVYHIFETAANVPSAIEIAAKCVRMVCDILGLQSTQELLRLFSSQVLYTWLDKEGIEAIPFKAFAYENLAALLNDIQDEVVAQVAMRSSNEHVQQVVQCLGTSWDGLVEHWFAKIISYAIIADVTTQRSSREIGKSEMSIVQHLGEESYAKLARQHFAEAVSTIFLRMNDDRGFERSQSQDESDISYTETYRLICARSSSSTQLPPGQQPSFRAKHLTQILDRICTRAQETLGSIWTPALLVHVYRALLSDAKPSFGPLHMCAVLRKLRTVVSLAGSVALTGYPLQMLLHALRPYLTQFHSSEDAFGLFWYLLDHGKDFLKNKLPFVTGLSVAVFTALSKFASSSQESTTQESHFKSTMTKAQEFRSWLGKYLEELDGVNDEKGTATTFANIVQAAKQITKGGSSAKTTVEGILLFHLLSDQASERPLLSDNFFRLTLRSLSHDFQATAELEDDILYEDVDVLKIAPVLWSILNRQQLPDSFLIWAAQSLGRAYSLQGLTVTELHDRPHESSSHLTKVDVTIEDSYQGAMTLLTDLLWDEDGVCAGASEATLQCMFSALPPSNRAAVLGTSVDQTLYEELRFSDLHCPSLREVDTMGGAGLEVVSTNHGGDIWASDIVKRLSRQQKGDPVLSFLPALIDTVPTLAPKVLPFVVHLSLFSEANRDQAIKSSLTELFTQTFDVDHDFSRERVQLALKTVVYLRRCILPSESSMAKRNMWLAIDFGAAAEAAIRCEMYRTALLMLEVDVSQHTLAASRSSRRISASDSNMAPATLASIYQNVDDPDFFYGTHEEADVASVVEKLCHEGRGYKALSFQSALFDSNVKIGGVGFALNVSGNTTISALSLANLNGLSNSISSFMASEQQGSLPQQNLQAALNLHQWDIPLNSSLADHSVAVVTALRTLSTAPRRDTVLTAIDESTLDLTKILIANVNHTALQLSCWTSLAALAEMKQTVSTHNADDLETLIHKHSIRRPWTEQESFECIEPILLSREATLATIKNDPQIRTMMGVSTAQAMLLEIKTLRSSLSLGHVHEMSQFCLNRAAYLSELLPSATELGLKVEAAIQYDLANTFWSQQETAASIRILQTLYERDIPDQAIEIRQSEILTDLGSKITEARLDRPDEVTAKYLLPAIKAVGKERLGSQVGRVFHNFASFCDSQLRDPDNIEEYERVEKIRNRKAQEVHELEVMYKKGDTKTRDTIKSHYLKARTWFKLDDEELKRLNEHRDRLIRNCLENYLLSLRACEDYPNDVLRFLALWMEQSSTKAANTSVSKHLLSVPTHKFAPLMNQLSSRILNEESPFQQLLSDLMYRICEDHPFHSLYQIFATSKSKGAHKDEVANSRHAAATKLSEKVMRKSSASNLWISIHNSNIQFVRVAQEKISDKELKTGSKLQLRKLSQGAKLEQTVNDLHQKIPPPTMKIAIRPDKDYSSIPTIAKFDPLISIAGGVSAPKIITVIAGDGSRYKMLLKGGNDDLRQDSIMEQVFEQVSNLLKDHRATRQRKLGIRTYKVIPLTHNAGIIEFVRDTMPLHDYVLPAHTRYYPKDYKPQKCRKDISDAQAKPFEQRLQAYRNVVVHFHPVMRFFFMEHFLDPDDWFQKRLNYSRSTAAISMLGHVLGLGDRHGHNILLDTKTGDVVHIDLGVAFEAGRVLPVPEVVPFRLTRDLVDGMGLSGVEGVFRRCCNFTLEALRNNQEAIMTILDVLRWDPLYSWSVSPLRLARMQENQEQAANADTATNAAVNGSAESAAVSVDGPAKKNNVNEPSEADRALAVVSKKLGKSLSVEATVNELIRQAMDERNLAVLYCGWAAYA